MGLLLRNWTINGMLKERRGQNEEATSNSSCTIRGALSAINTALE